MKYSLLIFGLIFLYHVSYAQTLQTVTSSGNNTSNAMRITGKNLLQSGGDALELYYNTNTAASVFSFNRSTTTFKPMEFGALNFNFRANGISSLYLTENGKVGIGTQTPAVNLQLGDGVSANKSKVRLAGVFNLDNSYHAKLELNDANFGIGVGSGSSIAGDDDLYLYSYNGPNRDIRFLSTSDGNTNIDTWQSNMIIKGENGNVGIGTLTPDSKLTVAGKISSREIKVSVNAGADFVFQENYSMPSLDEVEQYVTTNQHLPGIAPAEDMKANGLDLGEMNIKLLQKIEELTLYIIEVNKKVSQQQAQIEKLVKK